MTANTFARWERGETPVSRVAANQLNAIGAGIQTGSAISRNARFALDPFHRDILQALNSRLDPSSFESCAAELIRQDGWRVAPVGGTRDEGFDGAIADSTGEPIMLVCTTSQNFVGNLKRNVQSARKSGWRADRVILASSRHISGTARNKLYKAAEKSNVSLVQCYDQDWFAYRLYHDPSWTKSLLKLSGRPRALSAFPKTKRPVRGDELIGRERELHWLIERTDDCVLVGGPAVGKTFILRALVQEGRALFLVDDDRETIANDLRELQPSAVIIDDAHVRIDLLESFLELRQSISANEISVIAACWPGATSEVQSALGISSDGICAVEQISDGKVMIDIIKSCGLQGPDALLGEIRRQSGGRPGLAATLAHLCVAGDIERVVTGEALLDQLTPDLDRMLDSDTRRLLAPFALGGDAGAAIAAVANQLGAALLGVSSDLARLADAGLVMERHGGGVCVQPVPLRWALVRDVFFGGTGSLNYLTFLEVIESRHDGLKTLIGAQSRGAQIPDLTTQIEAMRSSQLWQEYAQIGRNEVEYVLREYPELLAEVADAALAYSPETAIALLLQNAATNPYSRSFGHQGPIEALRGWVSTGLPLNSDAQEVMRRRSLLVIESSNWWNQGRDGQVAISAMINALDPKIMHSSLDPGDEDTLTIARGIYPRELLVELTALWPTVFDVACESEEPQWSILIQLALEWGTDGQIHGADPETLSEMSEFAKRILEDVAEATRDRPGVQHLVKDASAATNIDVDLKLDYEFELLFRDWSVDVEEMERIADQFKDRWAKKPLRDVSERLVRIDLDATQAGIQILSPILGIACGRLASAHKDPLAIADRLVANGVSSPLVEPFLHESTNRGDPNWPSVATRCIKSEKYRSIAITSVIRHPNPPSALLDSAITLAGGFSMAIEAWCLRGEVSECVLAKLLDAPDKRIATAAAIGHWLSDPRGEITASIEDSWRAAILRNADDSSRRSVGDGYWLGKVLSSDGQLAQEFLTAELGQRDRHWLGSLGEGVLVEAIGGLNTQQRREVIRALPIGRVWPPKDLVKVLIGEDLALYKELLSSPKLHEYHLAPLSGQPNDGWGPKAKLALDAGCNANEILSATLSSPMSWVGPESGMWVEWREAFETVGKLNNDDPRVVDLARRGKAAMQASADQARLKERERGLYGR